MVIPCIGYSVLRFSALKTYITIAVYDSSICKRSQRAIAYPITKFMTVLGRVYKILILRTLKNVGFLEIKRLLASENEFSSFQAAC